MDPGQWHQLVVGCIDRVIVNCAQFLQKHTHTRNTHDYRALIADTTTLFVPAHSATECVVMKRVVPCARKTLAICKKSPVIRDERPKKTLDV